MGNGTCVSTNTKVRDLLKNTMTIIAIEFVKIYCFRYKIYMGTEAKWILEGNGKYNI